ncbi:hypothetical protein HanPSC8_Chr10g0406181 [Helianthus annuus]|nr:hypothetical protein HanPSC8_Chr10g0406181 [Helianthus annuus]
MRLLQRQLLSRTLLLLHHRLTLIHLLRLHFRTSQTNTLRHTTTTTTTTTLRHSSRCRCRHPLLRRSRHQLPLQPPILHLRRLLHRTVFAPLRLRRFILHAHP